MPDDRKTSELISQSLSGDLTTAQDEDLQQSVADSREANQFQNLSRLIQDSLSDVAHRTAEGDPAFCEGLTSEAKQRLRDSVRIETLRRSSDGSVNQVDSTLSGTLDEESALTSNDESESRQMTSRFLVQRELGSGALGVVWLARDEKLKRSVALKEMSAEAAEYPRAWHRFCREAEITGYLEHPNVVPLYQFGNDPQTGRPFYAMRFVGKRTLAEAIVEYHERLATGEDASMSLHKLLSAFLGVCQAVAYAHSKGVIHRDLKPENVALDSFGQVIVLDWGLARLTDEFEAGNLLSGDGVLADSSFEQTMAGEVIGTPLYMAPEQASGDQDHVDERTDVYGLGAILFAMLTGSAPHATQSHDDGSVVDMKELLRRVAENATPDPAEHRADIPAGLVSICKQALSFRQHLRYQTATELADAVERWMAGRSRRRELYGSMQSEGRELRTNLLSFIRNLERNTRFMSSLPPIQGIIDAMSPDRQVEDVNTWRQRLAVIFGGLLQTNSDFSAVSYCRVEGDQFREVVRLERGQADAASVRSVPASRLRSDAMTECLQATMDRHPDDVSTSILNRCSSGGRDSERGFLVSTVPVFDEQTEEPFGFVMLESCLTHVVEDFLQNRLQNAKRVYVLNDKCEVLLHMKQDSNQACDVKCHDFGELCSQWANVRPELRMRGEYVDEQTHAIYATRVSIDRDESALAIVLLAEDLPTIIAEN